MLNVMYKVTLASGGMVTLWSFGGMGRETQDRQQGVQPIRDPGHQYRTSRISHLHCMCLTNSSTQGTSVAEIKSHYKKLARKLYVTPLFTFSHLSNLFPPATQTRSDLLSMKQWRQ